DCSRRVPWAGSCARLDAPNLQPALRRERDRPADVHSRHRTVDVSRAAGLSHAGASCGEGGSDGGAPLRIMAEDKTSPRSASFNCHYVILKSYRSTRKGSTRGCGLRSE